MSAVAIVGSNAKGDQVIPFLVEVELVSANFLAVKESLERIGLPGKPNDIDGFPTLHQTCHILYKRGRYYICHYKHLFALDGKDTTLSRADIARQNTIIALLEEWGLIRVVSPMMIQKPTCSLRTLKVVKHKERHEWKFVSRYDLGSQRNV
jgi:hypothetical protein